MFLRSGHLPSWTPRHKLTSKFVHHGKRVRRWGWWCLLKPPDSQKKNVCFLLRNPKMDHWKMPWKISSFRCDGYVLDWWSNAHEWPKFCHKFPMASFQQISTLALWRQIKASVTPIAGRRCQKKWHVHSLPNYPMLHALSNQHCDSIRLLERDM